MAHDCKHLQPGHNVCAEHILTRDGLRYRFKKMMTDIIDMEQLTEWHELMLATMLPATKTVPLDDQAHSYIDKIAKDGIAP